jgi:catechol-2,3-dioxygenase
MPAVQRLNHAVLYVRNAETSSAFYQSTLGFEVAYAMPGAVFLRAKGTLNDHDLGLFSVGSAGSGSQSGRVGLYHLAWQVDTLEDLAAIRESLSLARALVGESDHGRSKSLYAKDPDGIEFEVMWALPRSAWSDTGAGVARLDLAGELASWPHTATGHEANVEPQRDQS